MIAKIISRVTMSDNARRVVGVSRIRRAAIRALPEILRQAERNMVIEIFPLLLNAMQSCS